MTAVAAVDVVVLLTGDEELYVRNVKTVDVNDSTDLNQEQRMVMKMTRKMMMMTN